MSCLNIIPGSGSQPVGNCSGKQIISAPAVRGMPDKGFCLAKRSFRILPDACDLCAAHPDNPIIRCGSGSFGIGLFTIKDQCGTHDDQRCGSEKEKWGNYQFYTKKNTAIIVPATVILLPINTIPTDVRSQSSMLSSANRGNASLIPLMTNWTAIAMSSIPMRRLIARYSRCPIFFMIYSEFRII